MTNTHVSIRDFYLSKENNEKSLIDQWHSKSKPGAAIVPSIYIDEYQKLITSVLIKYVSNKHDRILSIGSGCGSIELKIKQKGYANITCLDFLLEFTDITKLKGLSSITASAFDIPKLGLKKQNIIYLDGSLGHLSNSYIDNFNDSYSSILSIIKTIISSNCYVIFSDDEPYNDRSYQLHPRTHHLRVSEDNFVLQLENSNFEIIEVIKFNYNRPNVGKITRRIVVSCVKKLL